MSSAPQFYVDSFKSPISKCKGCMYITTIRWGQDADREICVKHPCPHTHFFISYCKDYTIAPHIRELISIIENILLIKG